MYPMMMLQAAGQLTADALQAGVASATDNAAATFGLAVVVPVVLQAVKNASWFPWLTRQTPRINFIVGVIAAAAATFGVHATWDPQSGGTITLPGLVGIWQGLVQWSGQQSVYKGFIVPAETLGDIRAVLERMEIGQIVEQQRAALPATLPPPMRMPPPAPPENNPGRL